MKKIMKIQQHKIWNILLNRKSKEKKKIYLDAYDDIKDYTCWVFWLISVGYEDMVSLLFEFFDEKSQIIKS